MCLCARASIVCVIIMIIIDLFDFGFYFGFLAIVKEVLVQRLDERVDDMIRRGLLTELAQFHQLYNARRLEQHA